MSLSFSLCLSLYVKLLTVRIWSRDGGWVGLWSLKRCCAAPPLRLTWVDLVHSLFFCLHPLNFLNILQPIDGTAKIDLPYCWVTVLPIFARVNGPLSEQSSISLSAVASLLSMNPRNLENGPVWIDPLQTNKPFAVDHSRKRIKKYYFLKIITCFAPANMY